MINRFFVIEEKTQRGEMIREVTKIDAHKRMVVVFDLRGWCWLVTEEL